MNSGYVKLYRKALENGWLANAQLWQFMSWCLLKASHKKHKQFVGMQQVELEPGQFIFGRSMAVHELNSTDQKIRTCLETLKKADFLTARATNKYTIITITNWHTYQDEQPATNQQDNQQGNQQITTNKNVKNIRESSLRSDSSSEASAPDQQADKPEGDPPPQPNPKAKPKPELAEDSIAFRLARLMRDELTTALPTLKEPNLQNWARDFDVALRNDKRMDNPNFVAAVIRWVANDDFWRTNCQCPATLRKQFDKLTARMEAEARRARDGPQKPVATTVKQKRDQERENSAAEYLAQKLEKYYAQSSGNEKISNNAAKSALETAGILRSGIVELGS